MRLEIKIIFLFLLILVFIQQIIFSEGIVSFISLYTDSLSNSLIYLRLFITLLIIFAWGPLNLKKNSQEMLSLTLILIIILILAFSTKNILYFYIFFELSLIPIVIIVFGWGGQPERLKARQFLVIYTVVRSFFLLMVILMVYYNSKDFNRFLLISFFEPLPYSVMSKLIVIRGITCFLVKFPIFGVHLWLPKAHVEAPVSGSMVLAAVLLKLGGYGLLRFNFLIPPQWEFIEWVKVFSLTGGALVGVYCTTLKDLKVLIAYSSVSHIAIVIYGCLSQRTIAVIGAILLILAHGITSSGLFAIANLAYERSHTRNMIINIGILRIIPLLRLLWFILCLSNFGGPPSINLFREILLIIFIFKSNLWTFILLTSLAFFALAYSLLLYIIPNQSQPPFFYLSAYALNIRETDLLIAHGLTVNIITILSFYLLIYFHINFNCYYKNNFNLNCGHFIFFYYN